MATPSERFRSAVVGTPPNPLKNPETVASVEAFEALESETRASFTEVGTKIAPIPGMQNSITQLQADVDALEAIGSTGVKWKDPVRTVALVNTSVSSGLVNGAVVNGVTLATGDRVLLVAQSTPATNGPYIVPAAGAASRATDADTGAEILAAGFFVKEGATDAGSSYVLTTPGPITIGTTALAFTKVAGLNYGMASNPVAIAGTAIDQLMNPANTKAVVDARLSGNAATIINDGLVVDFMGGFGANNNKATKAGDISSLPGSGMTFFRASTKRVTGPDGLQKNYANNEMAYVFDQRTRSPLGVRLEDAVTNLILKTLLGGTGWSSGGVTATINAAANADGTNTATQVVLTGTTNHYARNPDLPVVDGSKYVYEALVKRVSGTGSIWIINTVGASEGVRFFWQSDGTLNAVVSHGTPHTYGWEYAGNGFYRLWVGWTATGGGGLVTANTYFADATGNNNHPDAGTWHHGGAWFYEGTGLRNAPDTTGTSASSIRDVFQLNPAVSMPRLGTSGTIEVEVGPWVERAQQNATFFQLHNSGGSERILVRNGPVGSYQVIVQVTNAAGTSVNLSCGLGKQAGFRVTVTWSPDGVKVYDSGIEAASNAIVLNMAAADTCFIGPTGSAATTNALFRKVSYAPYRKSAAEIGGAAEGAGSFKLGIVGGRQVIIDGLGNPVSPSNSNVYSMFAESAARLAYSSDMYNGSVLSYRQVVPGSTPVLRSHRERLLGYCASGQSLGAASTTYDGALILPTPLHPPVVLCFPVGPNGFNGAAANTLGSLIPAKSIKIGSGTTVGDGHNLSWAYGVAERTRNLPYQFEPITLMNWAVGGMSVAELSKGGSSISYSNFQAIIAAFAARAADLDMDPVVPYMSWNQGEANTNTGRATYKSALTALFDDYQADIKLATGQDEDVKFIIQQLGSRIASSLPSGICEVPLAQMEMAEQYAGCYLFPLYWTSHNYAVDQSHTNYAGYLLMGELQARVSNWIDEWANRDRIATSLEGDWIGCKLLSATRTGTTVKLKFNVPLKHLGHSLAFDATHIPAFPDYGIRFLDNGVPIALTGTPTITAPDEITINLSSAPTGTTKVDLGYTNTTPDSLGFIRPGTNIRTTWSKPSLFIPGVTLFDWAAMGEKAAA